MEAELQAVLASPAFVRSPILSKLLSFLVAESVAGRGEALKSYTVAVDGLGRSDDFDAQADSYPRVQVARLRKLLESHYAANEGTTGVLKIPVGSYAVHLASLRKSTRDTSLSDALGTTAPDEPSDRPAGDSTAPRHSSRAKVLWIATASIFIAFVIGMAWFSRGSAENGVIGTQPRSPMLVVAPVVAGNDSASHSISRDISAMLQDGLGRGWPAVVGTTQSSSGDGRRLYRLETELGSPSDQGRVLYARLFDQGSASLVWSSQFKIDAQGRDLDSSLDILISQLIGSYGVITRSEAARLKEDFSPGYACVLQYFRFEASRNQELGKKVRQCLALPAQEDRIEGTRRANLAMLVLDVPSPPGGRATIIERAAGQADMAVQAYPDDTFTHFAAARLAYARGDCERGGQQGRIVVRANPYDPLFVGVIGVLSSICRDSELMGLTDRAFHYEANGDTSARLTTIMAAIVTQRRDRLNELAQLPVVSTSENAAFNAMCNTLLFAALDRPDEARAAWAQFRNLIGRGQHDPDELMREFIVSDLTRKKMLAFLREKAVVQ